MEDNLIRVFSVLVSVLILFIMPLYITFEKMDDISYSLALKITSNFVDNVNAKGYITEEMYNDFESRLSAIGMTFDIKMEHIAKKYNPVYYAYNESNELINTFDYSIYSGYIKNSSSDNITIDGKNYIKSNINLSYMKSEVKFTERQIIDKITSVPTGVYTMNKGDEFGVRIKNNNVTIATVLFNAFTLGIGGNENNTRVYINYGGVIQEEEFLLGDVDLDGNLTKRDSILIMAYSAKNTQFSKEQLVRGDINKDGKVDTTDSVYLDLWLNQQ